MIAVEQLTKVFTPPRMEPVEAVRGVSFTVGLGEIFGLLGPNGAGKTTLLRMLAGIIAPTRGRCQVGGVWADESPDDVRRQIGFLSGNTRLYGRLTPHELLQYFGRLYGMANAAIEARAQYLAARLDMAAFFDRRCETLSTGQAQRVSIARVLLHEPPVLILDEPTLGLDIMSSRAILEFIQEAKEAGHSIIFSTHYMTEAEYLCDRIGLIHQGRLLALDSPEALCAQTGAKNLQEAFLALVDEEAPAPA